MIKNARLIRLFTQSILALILLISPVSGHAGSVISAHPKIHTEWVSTHKLRSVSVWQKRQQPNHYVSPCYQLINFSVAVKLKSNQTQWLNHSQPRTLLQKTIPFGTEDELSA
ncbi:MAG TPA: hypothetical protein DHV26_07165 [Cytophagales bacterium]|nr:hypothetical protein [Cytophagales bacterium]HRG07809.1 hypothetical protein [Cyclobacteriaceae bacterium]